MSNKTASVSSPAPQADASELSLALSEARRQLAAEVKMRREVERLVNRRLLGIRDDAIFPDETADPAILI